MKGMQRYLALAAVAAVVACDNGPAGPEAGLTADESDVLASEVTDFGFFALSLAMPVLGTEAAPGPSYVLAPIEVSGSFSFTRTCPEGGQIGVEGTREGTIDRENRSRVFDASATKTHEECAFQARNHVVTLNGAPNLQSTSHHAWKDGGFDGLQTMTVNGAFDWATDDGRSGTCEVDLSYTFDPSADSRTVTGSFCGRDVDRRGAPRHRG